MFNIVTSLVVTGVLSATAVSYLADLESHTKQVTVAYVDRAEQRFQQYNQLLSGVVEQ